MLLIVSREQLQPLLQRSAGHASGQFLWHASRDFSGRVGWTKPATPQQPGRQIKSRCGCSAFLDASSTIPDSSTSLPHPTHIASHRIYRSALFVFLDTNSFFLGSTRLKSFQLTLFADFLSREIDLLASLPYTAPYKHVEHCD